MTTSSARNSERLPEGEPGPTDLAELRRQIAELRERLAAAESASLSDPLTGLPNLRAWERRFTEEEERARRAGEPAVVVVLDLDELKVINDTRGHAAGDELLRVTARVLRSSLRLSDVIARAGGDEFRVLVTGSGDVAGVGGRIRSALQDARVEASVGAALAEPGDYDRALERADSIMYATKKDRRRLRRGDATPEDGEGSASGHST